MIQDWEVKRLINGVLVAAGELAQVLEIEPESAHYIEKCPTTGRKVMKQAPGVWGLKVKLSKPVTSKMRVRHAFDQSGFNAVATVREQEIWLRPVVATVPYQAPEPVRRAA